MNAPSDPESLADRADVPIEEERRVLARENYEYWDTTEGLTALGVVTDAGEVLLMDGPHGWALPYTPVERSQDWMAVARDAVERLTGVVVEVAGPERVTRIENRLQGEEDRRTTSYEVVFRSEPVGEGSVATELSAGVADDELPAVAWFDEVPEDSDGDDDIQRFVD